MVNIDTEELLETSSGVSDYIGFYNKQTADSQKIQETYIGLLGRAADKLGLDYWLDQMNSLIFRSETPTKPEFTISQLSANFINSQTEVIEQTGSMTRESMITMMYENLFERAPEAQGLEYWNSGGGKTVGLDVLVLALVNGAGVPDKTTLENKVEVASYYTDKNALSLVYEPVISHESIANVTNDISTVTEGKAKVDALILTNESTELALVGTHSFLSTDAVL